jgi:hypothetical protein
MLKVAVNNTKNHKDKIRALWERIREKAEKKKQKKTLKESVPVLSDN